MKTIGKLTAVAAVAAATVAVVRKYDLINKGAALAEQGVEKAATGTEWLTAKATELGEKFLNQFVDEDDLASDPTEDLDPAAADKAAYADAEASAGFRQQADSVGRVGFGDVR